MCAITADLKSQTKTHALCVEGDKMAQSPGKKFEEDFSKSVPKDWFCYRLKDSAGSWANTSLSRFTPKNSCDFFIFTGKILYGIECKSFKGKSMPYSNIKDNQIKDLLEMSVDPPVNARGIFILNFRDINETYCLNAFMVNALMQSGKRKSISLDEARANGILIPQKLKRVRYKYDLSVLEKTIKYATFK